jgi:hypothetical protein
MLLMRAVLLTRMLACSAISQGQESKESVAANPGRPTASTPATLTPVGYLQLRLELLVRRTFPSSLPEPRLRIPLQPNDVASSGIVVNYRPALNQHCSAIYHNGLPRAESFLHQK